MKTVWFRFRFLWSCVMNVGWRERNQQDATNPMFIIKLLSQHVLGIIMPIIRRTRPCTTAYGVLHNQCRTPHAVVHSLVLLMMGILVPETCWDRSLIINMELVASCWFFSLFTVVWFSVFVIIVYISDCFVSWFWTSVLYIKFKFYCIKIVIFWCLACIVCRLPVFQRNVLPVKMEAVCSFETLVTLYQSTWHYIPEDCSCHCKWCWYLHHN